jgi:hypothetical protein
MVKSTTNTTNTSLTRASVTTRGTTTTTETDTHTATAGSSYKDVLKYPTTYTAYFVAKGAQGDYRDGEIVRTASITLSGTTGTTVNVKVPAIKYNIIVTDYNPDSNIYKVGGTIKDSNVNDTYEFSNKLPLSSTDMHMYGSTQKTTKDASGNSISNNGDFSATTSESSETGTTATQKTATAYVTLNSPYALVCVAANDFVSGVVYNGNNSAAYSNSSDQKTAPSIVPTTTGSWNVGGWWYLYINVVNKPSTDYYSTITVDNIVGAQETYKLSHTSMTAANVYEYTINDNFTGATDTNNNGYIDGSEATDANGNGLVISVTGFNGTVQGDNNLSVY